jgi:hypothetical protein
MKKPYYLILFYVVYFVLQRLIDYFELVFLPLIPQVIFFFYGIIVIYILLPMERRKIYFFIYTIPLLSGAICLAVTRQFDGVYISFLAINALVFYIPFSYSYISSKRSENSS